MIYKIKQPIRLIELFAGIGSQAKSLKNIGANFEYYKVVEFDKAIINSYNAIHNTNFEALDIKNISAKDLGIVDTGKYCYIMTYSFPCTDLSLAGKQKGMIRDSQTNSSLLWEVERLLNESLDYYGELPQVLLMENVSQIHNSKNIKSFKEWIKYLESLGYSNYWQDLNGLDYNVPQGRKRTFMVSILGNYKYNFPKKIEPSYNLKDYLRLDYSIEKYWSEALEAQPNDTISRRKIWEREIVLVDEFNNINTHTRTITTKQDRSPNAGNIYFDYVGNTKSKFRYLTPRECFLLMGFSEEDFEKASKVNSNTQLYKQVGNSIIVPVLEAIFKELL